MSHIAAELEPMTCLQCGVMFAIDKDYFLDSIREHIGGAERPDGEGEETPENGWFYCPNGHAAFFKKTAREVYGNRVVDLSRKLEAAEAKLQASEAVVAALQPEALAYRAWINGPDGKNVRVRSRGAKGQKQKASDGA